MHPDIVHTVFLGPCLSVQRNVRGGVADLHGGVRVGSRLSQVIRTILMAIGLCVCIVQ